MNPYLKKLATFNFGKLYICLIPIFAIFYYLLPPDYIDYGSLEKSPITCLYYSIVTITTLGYGDISPLNSFAAILVSIECLTGIITIGLFLNTLSYRQHEISKEYEKDATKRRRYLRELDKMIQYAKIIDFEMDMLMKSTDNIDNYNRYSQKLQNSLKELIMEINMRSFPEFEKLCIDFIAANLNAETNEIQLHANTCPLLRQNILFIDYFRKEIALKKEELNRYYDDDYWA